MATAALAEPPRIILAHEAPVNHIVFSPDGGSMATSDTQMEIRVWRDGVLLRKYQVGSATEKVRSSERVRAIAFDPTGEFLFVSAADEVSAFAVSANEHRPAWTFSAPRSWGFLIVSPTDVVVSPEGNLAAAFDNGMLVTWAPGGIQTATIRHHAAPRRIAFRAEGELIGFEAFHLSTWAPPQRKPVWRRHFEDRIYAFAVSRDGAWVARRHLWYTAIAAVETGEEIARREVGRGLPLLTFVGPTRMLAIGTQHAIHLEDLETGEARFLLFPEAELISLTASPDGGQVLAGCADGSVRSWTNPFTTLPITPKA